MIGDFVPSRRVPQILSPTPEENAHARELCRRVLDRAVIECASALRNQPLSIRQLMARLLIEDFATLDVNATRDWLDANDAENAAVHLLKEGDVRRHRIDTARAQRCDAFDRLAQVQIERREWS